MTPSEVKEYSGILYWLLIHPEKVDAENYFPEQKVWV